MINNLFKEMMFGVPSTIVDNIHFDIERNINHFLIDSFSQYISDVPDYSDNGRKCFDMQWIISRNIVK